MKGRLPKFLATMAIVVVASIVVITLAKFMIFLNGAKEGEAAGALGNVVGGIIGAAGSAAAVYLMLSAQRKEESEKVLGAVLREMLDFSRLAEGHLETCENVYSKRIVIPLSQLASAMKMPTPIIYSAIADRIARLPAPQRVVAFYTRISEIESMATAVAASKPPASDASPQDVRLIMQAWIDICEFARLTLDGAPQEPDLDLQARQEVSASIGTRVQSARRMLGIGG